MGMRPAEAFVVAKKKWNELSPRARRVIVAGGVFEGVLKVCQGPLSSAQGRS